MKNEFVELSGDELCPCGSGKPYGKCCKKKEFKFGYRNGEIVRTVKMSKELVHTLKEAEKVFFEMYGRKCSDSDFVVPFAGISEEDMGAHMVHSLRDAGIQENLIYATYKSGGLMPCEKNFNLMPERDLQEFSDLCQEYDETMQALPGKDHINALQFVLFADEHIKGTYKKCSKKLIMTLNDYVRRHSEQISLKNYEVKTITSYCIFLATKTMKTLTSIETLNNKYLTESIYALARSIYESYMYINAINNDQSFFNDKILPKVDTSNYFFDKCPNGAINFKRVIHNVSGKKIRVDIKTFDLKRYFTHPEDTELYGLFYEPACRYVHTDILSAQSYFHSSDPYDEIEPELIASIIALSLTVLLVEQIGMAKGTKEQYTKDINYLLKNIKSELITCFEIANSDPEYQNAVFETLTNRLEHCCLEKEFA